VLCIERQIVEISFMKVSSFSLGTAGNLIATATPLKVVGTLVQSFYKALRCSHQGAKPRRIVVELEARPEGASR
jgi:hypothetical protein